MFDWDRFKNGEIAVHCDTEEKAKHFLKECDKQGIMWSIDRANHHTNYDVYYETTCYRTMGGKLTYCDIEHFKRKGIEIIKWEVKEIEKTFREVIADIKEGQAWDDGSMEIRKEKGEIVIEFEYAVNRAYFDEVARFKLQRKEYTFEEAFKAYEEGKEIEDYRGTKYKKIDNEDHYKMEFEEEFNRKASEGDYWFGFDEIRGKWYIND